MKELTLFVSSFTVHFFLMIGKGLGSTNTVFVLFIFLTYFGAEERSAGCNHEHILEQLESQLNGVSTSFPLWVVIISGVRESNSPYRVIYRKEVFTPWYNPSQDRLATQLIHAQLRLGIHHGEYQCDKTMLVKIIAQHSYFNYGYKCTKATG